MTANILRSNVERNLHVHNRFMRGCLPALTAAAIEVHRCSSSFALAGTLRKTQRTGQMLTCHAWDGQVQVNLH